MGRLYMRSARHAFHERLVVFKAAKSLPKPHISPRLGRLQFQGGAGSVMQG
jgi:hypothetical protein